MPRAKRPLAEANVNVIKEASASKKAKRTPAAAAKVDYESKSKADLVVMLKQLGLPHSGTKSKLIQRLEKDSNVGENYTSRVCTLAQRIPQFRAMRAVSRTQDSKARAAETSHGPPDYTTKDNSKLKTLLQDRGMSISGTRDEMIQKLRHSAPIYENYSSSELSEMLKRRRLKMTEKGSKELKIQRVLLNDRLDWDTGDCEEPMMYGRLSSLETYVDHAISKREKGPEYHYEPWSLGQLSKLARERKISTSGSKSDLIDRLLEYDREELEKQLEGHLNEYITNRNELEARIGHPTMTSEAMDRASGMSNLDYHLLAEHKSAQPTVPICDYDWKDSHWASRTERQLLEICQRRGMPGHGPKAAMLKWLDTGALEYEDLYAGSLETMCRERGLKFKKGTTKVGLIDILKSDDEKE